LTTTARIHLSRNHYGGYLSLIRVKSN